MPVKITGAAMPHNDQRGAGDSTVAPCPGRNAPAVFVASNRADPWGRRDPRESPARGALGRSSVSPHVRRIVRIARLRRRRRRRPPPRLGRRVVVDRLAIVVGRAGPAGRGAGAGASSSSGFADFRRATFGGGSSSGSSEAGRRLRAAVRLLGIASGSSVVRLVREERETLRSTGAASSSSAGGSMRAASVALSLAASIGTATLSPSMIW